MGGKKWARIHPQQHVPHKLIQLPLHSCTYDVAVDVSKSLLNARVGTQYNNPPTSLYAIPSWQWLHYTCLHSNVHFSAAYFLHFLHLLSVRFHTEQRPTSVSYASLASPTFARKMRRSGDPDISIPVFVSVKLSLDCRPSFHWKFWSTCGILDPLMHTA